MMENDTRVISDVYRFFKHIRAAFHRMAAERRLLFGATAYMLGWAALWCIRYHIWVHSAESEPSRFVLNCMLAFYMVLLTVALLFILGYGVRDRVYSRHFAEIGFHNKLGETPILFFYQKTGNLVHCTFESRGIPLENWRNALPELENVLDMSVSEIAIEGKSDIIRLSGSKGLFPYGLHIYWNNSMLQAGDVLVLGVSCSGAVTYDINVHPHVLIGGATGSGKTWLLKHLLLQCVNKGYSVMIADFKGGVDYPPIWREKCTFVTEIAATNDKLTELCAEMERRKKLLSDAACRNIEKYNEQTDTPLPHIIFACDELAELLDCTGLSKEEKEQRKSIEGSISTIARLGRAFGIHLFLSTQRPDADVLPGQIKTNITYRICGRADSVLSRIILDSTIAAEKIPSSAQGVFIDYTQIMFRGFAFDDRDFFSDI